MNTDADPPFPLALWVREPFGTSVEYRCRSAFLPLPLGEGRGEGQRVPFFEFHHNHRTPLFPFSSRRLN
ncbi:hypothetical protein DMT41_18350 [Klebsiella variicola]|nr:hypothetical protein DMT41_18350 [Klebsiella variicola]HBX2059111.1 hypothetical protein [Klebsiella variicola]